MSIWFEDHANPHAMVNLNEEFLFFSGKHRKKHATFFIDFYILCMRMITCEKKIREILGELRLNIMQIFPVLYL